MEDRLRPGPPIELPVPPVGRRLSSVSVDVDEGLLRRLQGACAQVEVNDEARAQAGRDWWPLALTWALSGEVAAMPAAVARVTGPQEVADVLAICHQARVPVTASGGGSGVCGASIPVFGGVVLDLGWLAGVVDVDDESLLADVRPGTIGGDLEGELRAGHDLTLGHWPQSMGLSTVGGWLACRSAGQLSTRYGKIEDMVVGLQVALADGQLITTGGSAPRAAMGPDLTQLLVGSEGTLGVITQARLRLRPGPAVERRAAFGFGSFAAGLDACRRVLRRGATPAVLRLYDSTETERNFGLSGHHLLLVLDEGEPRLVGGTMAIVDEECDQAARLDDELVERWLAHRDDVSALAPLLRQGIVVDTAEVAARWRVLPLLYDQARAALEAVEGTVVASAHQSHAYPDGACLYFTFAGIPPSGGAADETDGGTGGGGAAQGGSGAGADAYYRAAWDAVMEATLAHGGALSHHHGIGLNRARYLPRALGGAFLVLVALKQALDPRGILNPGKLGLPSPFGEAPWP